MCIRDRVPPWHPPPSRTRMRAWSWANRCCSSRSLSGAWSSRSARSCRWAALWVRSRRPPPSREAAL
eukprot:14912666-Alexandrium_andersonii.AAC.1